MQQAATASPADPNSVEAVAAVKQLVLSQIDKKLKDLREAELIQFSNIPWGPYWIITTEIIIS